jgi:diguanylate cyclase (GGDEF)-like protein
MTFSLNYANTAFITCLVIILIVIDYVRKFNTNEFQRALFVFILAAAFVATLADFFNRSIAGMEGKTITILLYALVVLFYIAQNVSYYLMIVFMGYFVKKNIKTAKLGIIVIAVFLALYCAFVIASLSSDFFFFISPQNRYEPGKFYSVRLVISYLPMLLILFNSIISYKYFTRSQVSMLFFFGILTGGGAALDIVIKNSSITWPCFAAAMLYIYFFIIQNDTRIDSLTSIGNRAAFDAFINNLSHHTTKQAYAIAMIDMNDFKSINDTYGHSAGDHALVEMAQIIKANIRSSDFTARYGGDEFVIAIKAHHDMKRLMERIENAIDARNEKTTLPYKLCISYGYDCYTTHSKQNIDEFLEHIDQMMYEHKTALKTARNAASQTN